MSLESVKEFYHRLGEDEYLRQAIQSVQSKEECSQIVREAGFDFTPSEFEEYTAELLEKSLSDEELSELDDKELEAVMGGYLSSFPRIMPMYGHPIIGEDRLPFPKPSPIQPIYGVISPIE